MNDDSAIPNERVGYGIPLSVPTSFQMLPKFSGFNQKSLQKAEELERSYVRECGLTAGIYTEFSDVKPLIEVQDKLWNTLESRLCEMDRLTTCKSLYEKLEIIYGNLHQSKYDTAANPALAGRTDGSRKRLDMWGDITPYTEGIKFLIEMAMKHCTSDGVSAGDQIDFLIALSSRIVMLDHHLDTICGQIIPYEIAISPDFGITAAVTSKASAAIEEWVRSKSVHAMEADREWIDMLGKINEPKIQVEDFTNFPELITLDKAMTEELDYGFFDWLKYMKGCMDFFDEKDFLKVTGMSRLSTHLQATVGLNSEKIELLLQDHALSETVLKNLTHSDIMPMEKYYRDSRLLRRPLLDIKYNDTRITIFGVETFFIGTQVFFESLVYGTLRIPRMQKNGPMKSAIGRLQSRIGAPLRDAIAAKCRNMEYRVETEWIMQERAEAEQTMGPVDILVIDNKKRRFVLVEAKNLQSQGLVPTEMKKQKDRFLDIQKRFDGGFIGVLRRKEQSFVSNKDWHLQRLKMDGAEDYSVESVIVVRNPMFWPLVASEPLPILDDLVFYKRLQMGQHLLVTPIVLD